MAVTTDDPGPLGDDLVLLLQACSAELGERVLVRARTSVGDSLRYSDGYVFQHLVERPTSVTVLATRLGVTQQAASKQVAGLEARGFVRRRADPNDARARLVELTELGWQAVHAARTARRELCAEITDALGAKRASAAMDALRAISDHTGALEHMARRRLRAEEHR